MKVLRLSIALVCLLLPGTFAATPARAAFGDLDLTFAGFGAGGKVITDINAAGNAAYAVAVQPDDKIVVAGSAAGAVVVARYHGNGWLDDSFGGGTGYVRTPVGSSSRGQAVAIQSDGKIVVAGYATEGGNINFLVARYTAAGAIDTTFGGGDGVVTTDFGSNDDRAHGVGVQSNGKIVAAGFAIVGGDYDFAVARYCANGDLDNGVNCGAGGFGSGGKTSTGFGYEERGYALAIQPDDKIVVAGQSIGSPGADFALARYCPSGTLDNGSNCGGGGFDGDGKLTTFFVGIDGARAVALQDDGKIVAAGFARPSGGDSEFALARYCPNGSLDNGSNCGAGGFDGDGKVRTVIGGTDNPLATGVAVRADGTVVATGYGNTIAGSLFVTVLYTASGAGGSPITTDIASGSDYAQAIALQPDGRAVIAGYGSNATDDFVLIRLWQDGTLDNGGQQTLGFADSLFGPGSRDQGLAMALQADGKIVVAGLIRDAGASDTDFALARFLPDGRLDGTFGTNGRVTYGFGGDQYARGVVVQPDGKIVVGGYTGAGNGTNYMIVRFNANGTTDGGFGFGGFYVMDFLGGPDYGLALTLAPDGKLVMGGSAFNGARNVFGVARFTTAGLPDLTLDGDGSTLYEFYGYIGASHWGTSVVVQPDLKMVLGGQVGGNFGLVRLTETGLVDYGFGASGQTVTDMGGSDNLNALLLTPGGWFVAAGNRAVSGSSDFALAQYNSNGIQPDPGPHQPWAKTFIDFGGFDIATALDWRTDGQIVAAGCTDSAVAVAQLPSNALLFTPIKGSTSFQGNDECAYGVRFTGWNQILAGGYQALNGDANMALARFVTTQGPPPRQTFLPMIAR